MSEGDGVKHFSSVDKLRCDITACNSHDPQASAEACITEAYSSEAYSSEAYSSEAYTSLRSFESFRSCWEYIILNEKLRTMVQPEGIASPVTLPRYRKNRTTPPQDRRQKWRKNYMMMSLPCQADDVIKMNTLQRTDFHSFTQSLHRQSSKQRHARNKKKILKLLKQCAESIEGIASRSYVDSMKSCVELSLSDSQLSADNQNLMVFDDQANQVPPTPHRRVRKFPRSDSKNLSEIVLRDDTSTTLFSELGSGEVLYYSTDNQQRFVTPKLRMGGSFYSSYVEDSDFSYSQSEDDLSKQRAECHQLVPVLNRSDRYAKLNQYDYMDLVTNGKSTAFMSEHEDENNLSFYYDDEFGAQNSPLGGALHDSDLEAAICNEYASLLDTANVHFNSASVNGQSNISSDFDNIFPASLTSLRGEDNADEACISVVEENHELDASVPNYSDNIAAAVKGDYQITFAQAGSLYSDARSSCGRVTDDSDESDSECTEQVLRKKTQQRQSTPNQVPKPPRGQQRPQSAVQTSTKKVSFSDELAVLEDEDVGIDGIATSTTWQQMKQNYTTWGQVRNDKTMDPKKSRSVPDMNQVRMREKRTPSRQQQSKCGTEAEEGEEEEAEHRKRYSLTLWEQYKRAHSMSLSASQSELTTPQAFTEPTSVEQKQREDKLQSDKASQALANSINELLDDALGAKQKPTPTPRKSSTTFNLPDLSFLRQNKYSLTSYNWWTEIFDQPSFCSVGGSRTSSVRTCGQCDRKHSTDHHVILFQGSKPTEHKLCELSMLEQLLITPNTQQCQCTREKLCDLSSGIATGSSGVTPPREPNSWQHIADFLKRRQRQPDVNSRGSLNSTLSDQQLLDIVACIEAADLLIKTQTQAAPQDIQQQSDASQDLLLRVWKLVSALECVLTLGLKSHKLVTVAMGKIRTRVNIWDVVEESCSSAGELTDTFSKIMSEVFKCQPEDSTMRFCLFIVGLLNHQCLDFWLSILTHNKTLMDKYYNDDSFLRSRVIADKKLHTELIQALQPISLFTWDIDYRSMLTACMHSTDRVEPPRPLPRRQSACISPNQIKTTPISSAPRFYSANNVRHATHC